VTPHLPHWRINKQLHRLRHVIGLRLHHRYFWYLYGDVLGLQVLDLAWLAVCLHFDRRVGGNGKRFERLD